jgi:hypothetical protein
VHGSTGSYLDPHYSPLRRLEKSELFVTRFDFYLKRAGHCRYDWPSKGEVKQKVEPLHLAMINHALYLWHYDPEVEGKKDAEGKAVDRVKVDVGPDGAFAFSFGAA